jgi:TolB-like protein
MAMVVVVLPFEALSPSEPSRYMADGISQELIGDLTRFPGFRLYTLPIGFEDAAGPEPVELGRDLGVAYVVSGSVRADAEGIRVAAQLVDAVTGRVLWAENYGRALTPEALIRMQSELAGEIATVLGQPYGIVNRDLEVRQASPAVSDMQSYVCVLRAYGYRRSFSREEFGPVLGCLEEAVRRDPGYSDAWAMLGWLYLDAGRFLFTGDGNLQDQ